MNGKIENNQLVWISGEKDAQQFFQWNTPGIITNTTDTMFTIVHFDDFEEHQYEKAHYADLEKNGRAYYIGGVQQYYKNEIMFIDQNRMNEYTQQQEVLRAKKKSSLEETLKQAQNSLDIFSLQETFAEKIKEYFPDNVEA